MSDTKTTTLEEYAEILSDDEVKFLVNIAIESELIKKGQGLDELKIELEESKNDDGKAEIFRALGNIALGLSETKNAGEYFIKSQGLVKSDIGRSKINTDLSIYYTNLQKFDDAAIAIDDAIKIAGSKELKGESLNAKGFLRKREAKHDEAISHFNEATKLFKNVDSWENLSETHLNLGDIYFEKGDYDQAKFSYRESLRFAKKAKSTKSRTPIFFRLGETLMRQSKITPAMTYFEDCLKDKSVPVVTIRSLRNLAECYLRIGGEEDAEATLRKALKEANALNDEAEIALTQDALALLFAADGKLEEAAKELDQSYNTRRDYFERTGLSLEGSWEFAEASYLLSKALMDNPPAEPREVAPAPSPDAFSLSGKAAKEARHLIELIEEAVPRPKTMANRFDNLTLKEAVRLFKKEFLGARLEMVNWDKNKLAKQMGVTLSNLYHHLESLGMNK